MRFAAVVGFLVTALSVSAQTSTAAPSTNELLSELAQLPTCAVRIVMLVYLALATDTHVRRLV